MNVNMGIPGISGMNMEMHGNVTTSTTYHSESTVNGVTTSTTLKSSGPPPPVPVPAPAPVGAHGEVNMNVNFGFPSMTVETSVDDDFHGQAHAQVSFPGMSMNMKME